ncbi:MAG: uracil phosphoribosyltransferase [Candidatus Hydrogenedentota bacterium]|nr:MAG: uracil phosphoribosyltransferase [Candidatus Hydrogenedentota bacterium]
MEDGGEVVTGLHIPEHPVVSDRIRILRDAGTSPSEFRTAMKSLAPFLVYEAARGLPTVSGTVETPLGTADALHLRNEIVLYPILRAGLGLLEGALEVFPHARVGLIGAYRDETTFRPIEYHISGPESLKGTDVFVLDPMLATGGSAEYAIARIKERKPESIRLVSVIAAPAGVDRVRKAHPDVPIITAALDPELNDRKFIVPGLGDAGDRFFGT